MCGGIALNTQGTGKSLYICDLHIESFITWGMVEWPWHFICAYPSH